MVHVHQKLCSFDITVSGLHVIPVAFDYRVMLRDDAQPLWDSLFEHLVQLVTCKVMTPNEVAAVFVPCMVSDKSPYQDKVLITKI